MALFVLSSTDVDLFEAARCDKVQYTSNVFSSIFLEVLHTATAHVTLLCPMSTGLGARNWELLVGSDHD